VVLARDAELLVVATNVDPADVPVGVVGGVDVVVLDELSAVDGSAFGALEEVWPGVGVLVLAHEPARAYCLRILSLGARACISKNAPESEILSAVHLASDGQHLLVCAATVAGAGEQRPGLRSLTARERSVLTHLSVGHSNAQIALALHITIETARSHAASIYRKLGVRTRHELVGIDIGCLASSDVSARVQRQHSLARRPRV
jgi:DNA-binding NarL/FixJ family response regulator